MKLLKSRIRFQGVTLNSGVLMVNPDMDMCMRQCAEVDLNSNKYALRQCKRSEDTINADRLAGDLLQHNVVEFWKAVRNITSNSNKASNSTCIDAVVSEQNLADYWRSHYEDIFNSVQNTTHQNEILRKLETTEFHEDMTITTNEVAKVIKGLKRGKAVGPYNVAAEALMHSNN